MTNQDRIEIAKNAIITMPEYDTPETDITDLIADLLHLAQEEGLDPFRVARMAVNHFEQERDHE